jgi:hypothetical protein
MSKFYDNTVYEPIDLCACYEPIIEPPAYLILEWRRAAEKQKSFCQTVERKIGNTWYEIETVCDGDELLTHKVKRLIFSGKEVRCS